MRAVRWAATVEVMYDTTHGRHLLVGLLLRTGLLLITGLLLTTGCSTAPVTSPPGGTGATTVVPPRSEETVLVASPDGDLTTVSRVVDGDTFVTSDGETVRVLGIDTPETKHPSKPVECYGPEATSFAKAQLDQRQVLLEGEELDRYGRRLAHVWLQDGAEWVSYGLLTLEVGTARRYRDGRHSYEDLYVQAEGGAKDAGVGLWGSCP